MKQRSLTESKIDLPSTVETFVFRGRTIHIKRDDLVDPDLSGNKFRKLFFLLNIPSKNYKRIISYGGSQSNAMASIAALCKRKGWTFLYITKTLSQTLKNALQGNMASALGDGMKLLEVEHEAYEDVIHSLYTPTPDNRVSKKEGDLLLAQGGADLGAKEGIELLAKEILRWKVERNIENLTVITPSGTGTTSLYLARYMKETAVMTTPLVGSSVYLKEQMEALEQFPENLYILETLKKYHFAKPYQEYVEVYKMIKEQGIEMDLLYAPKMLLALSEKMLEIEGEILYVHSGGTKGNVSMLERYKRKGWCTV